MGLQDIFKSAAQTAFTAAGNIRETISYRSKTNASSTYNPVTGTVTDAYTDYDSLKMIAFTDKQLQIDGQAILPHDAFLMIPVENLTPTPKLHDQILRNSGTETWDIIWFETDAALALWKFQLRKL